MPPKRPSVDQRRFPVSPELRNLQAFCGDLNVGGYNQANFESPWYMFYCCALQSLLSTPPTLKSASSSRTRFALAPQYIFSLLRERTGSDSQAREYKIRKKFNRIPDFAVWFIDGAPQHPEPPRTIADVTTREHALEYFKGTCSISKAALLLCVEVKSLPDLQAAHVLADLPHSLEKAELARLSEAQMELTKKLVVHFSSCARGEQVVVLACAGSRFSWNVAVRWGSDVLSKDIRTSEFERDPTYILDLAYPEPTTSGVDNARDTTGNIPEVLPSSQRPKREAAIKSAAATAALSRESKRIASQPPSDPAPLPDDARVTGETRGATDKGKESGIPSQPSTREPTAEFLQDGWKKDFEEAKAKSKKPTEMRVELKEKWSPSRNWNDENSASEKARLWDAIRQANPGVQFWK